jgi:hypothetical protein
MWCVSQCDQKELQTSTLKRETGVGRRGRLKKKSLQFAQRFHGTEHSIEPIGEIIDALYIVNKGRYTNTLEKLYTHLGTKEQST